MGKSRTQRCCYDTGCNDEYKHHDVMDRVGHEAGTRDVYEYHLEENYDCENYEYEGFHNHSNNNKGCSEQSPFFILFIENFSVDSKGNESVII